MKRYLSLLIALCMALSLAACGNAADGDSADSAPDANPGEYVSSGEYTGSADFDWSVYEGVTVDIFWQDSDNTQRDIMNNYVIPDIDAVAKEHGFTVNWTAKSGDTDYLSLAASGSIGDIWFSGISMEMIEGGVILDLTPYLEVDTYLEDTYSDPADLYFNNHVWCLSTGIDKVYSGALYYNKTIFGELMIDGIETYDDLYDALTWCVDAGYEGLTFDTVDNSVYSRFLWQDTLISVDPEAAVDFAYGGEDAFLNPAVESAFMQIRELDSAGLLGISIGTRSAADAFAQFAGGSFAMLYTNSWSTDRLIANIATSEAPFEIGVLLWPSANDGFDTGEYLTSWGSPLSGWNVSADSRYPELAVELVKCICAAEARRHLTVGYPTNHVQDGSPIPPNSLEAERLMLMEDVRVFVPNWNQNAADNDTVTAFEAILNDVLNPGSGKDIPAILTEMDAVWRENTFFDSGKE